MGFLSKLFGRREETDDQREIRLYNEKNTEEASAAPVQNAAGRSVFAISDVFSITGRGTVVTGTVTEGSFSVGDHITIDSGSIETVITGIEQFRKQCSVVSAGENAGLLLRGVTREQVGKGGLIIK